MSGVKYQGIESLTSGFINHFDKYAGKIVTLREIVTTPVVSQQQYFPSVLIATQTNFIIFSLINNFKNVLYKA